MYIFFVSGHEQIDIEEMSGEVIEDAIYARNRRVEERYGIKIKETKESYNSIAKKTLSLVNSDDSTYDVIVPRINAAIPLAQTGTFLDLKTLENINTDKPWWDKNIVRDLSIHDKTFLLTGDIHLYANDATHIVLFNKEVLKDYDLEDVYSLVKDNKWTFDKFQEMATKVISDVDGDGKYLWGDRFGLQCAYYAIPALFSSANSPVFVKKDESTIEININSERFNNVFTSIKNMMNNDNRTLNMEEGAKFKIPSGDFSHEWWEAMEGKQCLFMIGVLDYMEMFKNVESPFGILPLPKFDDSQAEYISPVMADAMAICVPTSVADPKMVGLILETMAAESYGEVKNAYYDITLQRKRTRDDESSEMLDIIFSTRSYPLDSTYNWGNLTSQVTDLVKKNEDSVSSLFAKNEQKVNTAIKKTLDLYSTLES